jgi:hypothetical protein
MLKTKQHFSDLHIVDRHQIIFYLFIFFLEAIVNSQVMGRMIRQSGIWNYLRLSLGSFSSYLRLSLDSFSNPLLEDNGVDVDHVSFAVVSYPLVTNHFAIRRCKPRLSQVILQPHLSF